MKNKDYNKWIIGIDLDGTLLRGTKFNENNSVSPFTRKVLHEMYKNGHIVCIDTGRTVFAAKEVYKSIGLPSVMINNAGALIHNLMDKNFEKILNYLDNEKLNEILTEDKYSHLITAILWDLEDITNIQTNNELTFNFIKKFANRNLKRKREASIDQDKILSFNIVYDANEKNIYDILFYLNKKYGNEFNIIEWIWKNDEGKIFGIEINNKIATKGNAIMKIAKKLNISSKNTIGIGDSSNDIDLMKIPNLGVAVKNATDEIKELSNIVLDFTNEEEAVAKFLVEKFKLEI